MTSFQTQRKQRGVVYWTISLLVLSLATVLPSLAVVKVTQGLDFKYAIAYLAGISAATAFAYWSDKKKSETASWRTPEKTLHLLELLGGWTAAFVSQRLFRHKITKKEYQFTFWLICVLHQYLSFDYLHQWRYIIRFHQIIEPLSK
jgi:uncharacterized membrane protein YsdA (DUF1294 family)